MSWDAGVELLVCQAETSSQAWTSVGQLCCQGKQQGNDKVFPVALLQEARAALNLLTFKKFKVANDVFL